MSFIATSSTNLFKIGTEGSRWEPTGHGRPGMSAYKVEKAWPGGGEGLQKESRKENKLYKEVGSVAKGKAE